MLVISLRITQQPSSLCNSAFSICFSWSGISRSPQVFCCSVCLVGLELFSQCKNLLGILEKYPVVSVESGFCLAVMHRRGSHNILLGIFFFSQSIRTWNVVIHIFAYVQFWIQQDKKNLEPCVNSTCGQGRVSCSFSQSQIEEGKPEVKLLKQTSFNYS